MDEVVYYKDNPNRTDLATVTTSKGETEYKVNCRKIREEYYVINKDCFQVNQRWYRTDLLEFDQETKEYILKGERKLITGVIAFTKDGAPVMGNFSLNPWNNCLYINPTTGNNYIVLNPELLIEAGKVEDFSTGVWYDKQYSKGNSFQVPRNSVDHTTKGYNIEDNKDELIKKRLFYEQYKPVMGKDIVSFGRMLGDTTFGIEIECSHGFLPEHIQNRTGVVICRDGSLKDENGHPGPEFVTVPLSGAKGLQTLSTLGKELPKRTKINLNCSFHIHYGTLPTDRIYLVTLFRLCNRLQNEMFTMFPYYKANPDGIKNKNYNKKLPSLNIFKADKGMNKENFDEYINSSYKQIFNWLAEGYMPDKARNRKNKKHPVQAKWERHNRYYWVNFMNAIFSDRNTIEFRLHGPTTNTQKMTNWLFICNAILKYAMNNTHKILLTGCNITLNDIMDYYKKYGNRGEQLSAYLKAYIESRKEAFTKDIKAGDKISEWDYKDDSDYQFTFNNITNLF